MCFVSLDAPTSHSFVPSFPTFISRKRPLLRDARLASAEPEQLQGSRSDSGPKLIPIAQLNEIKESVDIVSAIETYGLPKFQRRGAKAATAICPFHDDHSPSLSIDGNRRMFKCFTCGVGGNIFKFVQEYNKLQGVEMSFYRAVREVAEKFTDDKVFFETSRPWNFDEEKYTATQAKKERVLSANTAAALFYAENLVNLPAAGRARTHLRSRGLSPMTVKSFSLGYAPDAFFQTKQQRGSGSLVEHLQTLGYSAQDLVDAGLAVRTKHIADKASTDTTSLNNNGDTAESSEDNSMLDYNSVMDRFRERLMVPILDAKGEYVVGFGGRTLATPEEEQKSGFKAPKYLNSPESVVFQKKYVLFGQQSAKAAIQSLSYDRRSLIIVEGYMDAISLWDAGVCEVVASMGTALSLEQLTAAAKLVGGRGGKIILCLDADDAGVAAVERLCSSNILRTAVDSSQVELFVASLPAGVKDPSEFIETKRAGNDQVGIEFRETVMAQAEEWTSWYIRRILSSSNSTDVRSFGQSFERAAEFLSTFPNPAERTRRASDVAQILTEMMAESGNTSISTAVRIQLEADLIDMVSNKAAAKESLKRRLESVANAGNMTSTLAISKFTDGMTSAEEGGKLSSKALKKVQRGGNVSKTEGPKEERAQDIRQRSNRRVFQPGDTKSRAKEEDQLTPHVSGFQFENPSDASWMGQDERKRGEKWNPRLSEGGYNSDGGREVDPVYFNSNKYLGQKLLTDSAVNAGYQQTPTRRDVSIFEKGVTSLIQIDPNSLVLDAEDKILRILVSNHQARSMMKRLLEAKQTAGAEFTFDWTCPEKEWLFGCLINKAPSDVTLAELWRCLSELPDTPQGAFGSPPDAPENFESSSSDAFPPAAISGSTALSSFGEFQDDSDEMAVDSSVFEVGPAIQKVPEINPPLLGLVQKRKDEDIVVQGCLDYLFTSNAQSTIAFEIGNPDQLRIELCVQESLSSLLWALSTKKFAETQKVVTDLSPEIVPVGGAALPEKPDGSSLTIVKQHDDAFMSSVAEVYNAAIKARELHNSAKQMASKLLDMSTAGVREGHVSFAIRREIDKTLQEIMEANASLPAGVDENDDDSTEDDDTELDDWGVWEDDDYEWVPGKQTQSNSFGATPQDNTITYFEDDMEEPLEEALSRMDAEWPGYV